jgi:hypothetical protein
MKRTRKNLENVGVTPPTASPAHDDEFSFGSETASCLRRELIQLPMESRQKVSQDLYGIAETTFLSQDCLEHLEAEIENIEEKEAYERALELSPEYVNNESFRVLFLRATEGDAKRAAKRITKHFKTKLDLFGDDKLVKDIEISDLDEYDMEALNSGGFQVLSRSDLAGRSILFGRYTCMRYRETKNMVRLLVSTA